MNRQLAAAVFALFIAAPGTAAGYTNAELKKMFQRSVDTEDVRERGRLRAEIAKAAPDSAYGLASRAYLMSDRLAPFAIASLYTKALELDPTIAVAYYNRSNIYGDMGQYEKAKEGYEKAISLGLKGGAVYQGIGDCYIQMGRDEEAIKFLSKAIALDPTLHFAYNNRGGVYVRTGQYDKAISDLTAALKLADFAMAYLNRGDAYAGKKEFQKALADYKTAEDMIGPEPGLLTRRGKTYLKMEEWTKAREEANAVLADYPDNFIALDVLGKAAFGEGDYAAAEAAYKRRAERDTKYAYSYEQLANVYAAMKRPDLAEEALKKALEREPGRKDLKDKLVRTQIRGGNAKGTEKSLTAVIASGKAEDADYFNRAEARLENKDYKGAEADLKLVLKRNPDSNSAAAYLALAFLGQGRRPEALEIFSSVADTDPARLAKLRRGATMGEDLPGANVRAALREMLKLYDGTAVGDKPAVTASAAGKSGKRNAAALAQDDCYCVYYTGKMPPYFIARVDPVKPGCEKIQFAPDPAKPGISGLRNCKEFQETE